MYTVTHGLVSAHSGEPVRIIFTITNQAGEAVTVVGGSATYKIARKNGQTALLTKTDIDGIALIGNAATVDFDTLDIQEGGSPATGDFFGQLTIHLSGEGLVTSEGPLTIIPVIV